MILGGHWDDDLGCHRWNSQAMFHNHAKGKVEDENWNIVGIRLAESLNSAYWV
jgi:hypothetical protein